MCIIIDANRLSVMFSQPNNEDIRPIHKWINGNHGRIVYSTGGDFTGDVHGNARSALAELRRSGKARRVSSKECKSMSEEISKGANCRSNDIHVLALAVVSNARLLYTEDKALQDDFKTGKWKDGKYIISGPRGSIYSGKRNSDLLTADVCKKK